MQPGMRLSKHILSVPWACFTRESKYFHVSSICACEFSSENETEVKKTDKKELTTRHSLAYNNKYLFGPLLETQAEKRRRMKNEALGDVNTQVKKRKKRKKKEEIKKVTVPSLIERIENSHYHLMYGSRTENGQVSNQFQNHTNSPYTTVNYLKESEGRHTDGNVSSIPKANSKRKKILIKKQEGEGSIAIGDSSLTDEGIEKPISSVNEQEQNCDERINRSSEIQLCFSGASTSVKDLINIDNSRWSAAPKSLDLNHIEHFPLYPELGPTAHKNSTTTSVQTIGMFEGGYQKLPSVRHILDETMPLSSKIALEKWKAKMINELGEKGFQQYREALLNRGKLFHECIQSELTGRTPIVEEMPAVSGLWTSVRQVLSDVSGVKVLESRVIHPYLYYQGAADCVADYKGMLVLIEWKTSGKQKLTLKQMYDDPLQVVAYMGALHFDGSYVLPQKVDNALLVVAYDSGLPAHTHILTNENLQHYWQEWCKRLKQYWKMQEVVL